MGILEGLPAGLEVTSAFIADELARRRAGHGRGPRMGFEADTFEIASGMRAGVTLGSPVALIIQNTEWAKWQSIMAPEGADAGRKLTRPRPGHADLPGMLKYSFDDARNVLERASARETAVRVALAAFAKRLLKELGVDVVSHVIRIGTVATTSDVLVDAGDRAAIDSSPVRCIDPEASAKMVEAIDAAGADGDSLGGVVEVLTWGLPAGIGSHVHWDRKLDGRLAGALMAVPAMKAVEIGDGLALAERRGSAAHDEIETGLVRATNRSGGTEGGMTTGGPLRVRAAMKPLSTLKKRLRTVDMETGEPADAFQERTDVCAVPAAGIVCEAVVALVVADAVLEMFGGDTMDDLRNAWNAYQRSRDLRA